MTVRVEEPTDEEWREVVETEYDGTGNLVRTTVGRGIDGRHGDGSEGPTFSEPLESLRNPYESLSLSCSISGCDGDVGGDAVTDEKAPGRCLDPVYERSNGIRTTVVQYRIDRTRAHGVDTGKSDSGPYECGRIDPRTRSPTRPRDRRLERDRV